MLLPDVGSAYEVIGKIGEGAMAEIYEARHRRLGRRVAIKLLHVQSAQRASSRERFEREALTLARIESAHVVAVLDSGHTAAGVPFLVLELLSGSDLRSILRSEGRLPVARAVRLVQQACWGMAAAHRVNLVHRDLKPENLFVVQNPPSPELCKVIDFGVARVESVSRALTRDGALVGTVGYMAPEQARGEAVDARVDVHALGLVLYELLEGSAPFTSESDSSTLFQIINQSPAPLSHVRPDVPEGLSRVVARALEKDARRRFASAVELAAALDGWGNGSLVSSSYELLRPPTASAPDAAQTRLESAGAGPRVPERAAVTPRPPGMSTGGTARVRWSAIAAVGVCIAGAASWARPSHSVPAAPSPVVPIQEGPRTSRIEEASDPGPATAARPASIEGYIVHNPYVD